MSIKTVGVPTKERAVIEYMNEYPLPQGVFLCVSETDSRNFYAFEGDNDVVVTEAFLSMVADVIETFYKTRIIISEISNLDLDRPDLMAYLGAMSAFNRKEEFDAIAAALAADNFANVDGVLQFRLDKQMKSWTELGRLAAAMLEACATDGDVKELIAMMLGLTEVDGIVKLVYLKDAKIEKNGKLYPIAAITGKSESDVLFSLLKEAPKSIVVSEPSLFSNAVLDTIKSLGEM